MTEADWLACEDRQTMLPFLRGRAGDRKLRLFAAACCRLVCGDESSRLATEAEVVERLADSTATVVEADSFRVFLRSGSEVNLGFDREARAWEMAQRWSTSAVMSQFMQLFDHGAPNPQARSEIFFAEESRAVCALVRDIFGNPFRPPTVDPRWQTLDAVALARGIYDDRAFDRLPLLADALMDAGCDDEQILAHCRSEGPHVRGCWVVDLVLARE